MKKITFEDEKRFIEQILKKESISESDAQIISDVLVEADLCGIHSHGLARLPVYIERLRRGAIESNTVVKKVKSSNNMTLFDGGNSMGQVASKIAMDECINLSQKNAISVVALNNSNHFGIASYYSALASKNNLIGIVATNTSPLMAPYGGYKAMLGTNPFTISIPANKESDIILDMATSQVARGKIEIYNRENKKIPLGWGQDDKGNPTDDPKKALEGTLSPVGGPKGYGMAIMVDILSGLLTGSTYLDDVGSLFDKGEKAQNLGMIMICINPSLFMDIDDFKNEVDNYIKRIRNSPRKEGVERIYLPGEIEELNKIKYIQEGIPITQELYKLIKRFEDVYEISIDDYLMKNLEELI